MRVRDRATEIKGVFYTHCREIVDGNIDEYSYEYVRTDTGFFFHYQNEGIDEGVRKPLNHLHVGIKKVADKKLLDILPDELIEHGGPHYMAPEMKFNDFMGMIIVNYFDNHKNRNRMMKALGLLIKE